MAICKVLLVEDELVLRETLEEILALSGFDVKAVDSGEHALFVLKDWQPNVIISDVLMPEMSGFELIEAVKKIDTLTHIPFIFLSALTNEVDHLMAKKIGAHEFMVKPFKSSEVVKAILKHVKVQDNTN
jgi:DNA-binding response OmpR family regulator